MKTWSRKFKIASLSVIVVFQLLAFLAPISFDQTFVETKTASAQDSLPDPLRPAAQEPTELPVYNAGVDQSIKDYLCTPEGTGTDLFDCIDRLYRFGISAGAILVVFFIVYAGYIYMTGSEAGKTKAKQTLFAAVTGMAVMLGSFVLLNFINPELVNIKRIQPPIFNAADLPSCEEIGFSTKCIITTGGSGPGSVGQVYNPPPGNVGAAGCFNKEQGGCTKNSISACPGMAANMPLALRICNKESGGGNYAALSGSDKCTEQTTGDKLSFSGGLWQINILTSAGDFPECAGVLRHVSPGRDCRVYPPYNASQCTCKYGPKGKSGYDACIAALKDPYKNTQAACKLFNTRPWPQSSNGASGGIRAWNPWSTSYSKCKNATS